MSHLISRATRPTFSRALFAALIAVVATANGASAEPAPFESYRAMCPGYGETRLTEVGSGGGFAPAFIEGSDQLLITYQANYTVTGGGSTTSGYSEKPAPLPDDAITCAFVFRFAVDGVLYTLAGTLTGVVRGRPA